MWRFACATALGVSHEKRGEPCQDRCRIVASGRWVIAALADGAGSASAADEGAELAVNVALEHIRDCALANDRVDAESMNDAATAARDAIAAHAEETGRDMREFASTLLLLAASDQGGAALQIGDGVIALNQRQHGWEWVFWPQRGEFANTTFFLTDANAHEQWEITELPAFIFEFALMSDGLEALAIDYATRLAHGPFFEGLLPALRQLSQAGASERLSTQLHDHFLMAKRVRERTDDDLSLIIAARDVPAADA